MNRTRDAYDRWSAHYDADPNPHTALEQAAVLEQVAPAPGDWILDAGCGTGRYGRLFCDRGARVVGMDFSAGMLREARAAFPRGAFCIADLAAPLPFSAGMFTKVNCAQALKHLPEIRPVLAEFARVITRDGTITFSVTHPEMNWDGYALSFVPAFVLSRESDIYDHRLRDYYDAIAGAGLKVADLRELAVDESIRAYLTPAAYARVKGRTQIVVFHAVKRAP